MSPRKHLGSRVAKHVPDTRDHDWREAGRCPQCGGTVVTLRRGVDYGRQVEHRARCPELSR